MADAKPLLFFDVDGVFNCLGENEDRYEHHWLDGIPVCVPPGSAGRVERLLGVYEPVWATAWLGRAHTAWRHVLGLSEQSWKYVDFSDLKLPRILRFAAGRRWAWVDDDAEWELRQLGWDRGMVEGYLVNPEQAVGLTDDHVERLLAYANDGALAARANSQAPTEQPSESARAEQKSQ